MDNVLPSLIAGNPCSSQALLQAQSQPEVLNDNRDNTKGLLSPMG
jgi:hypothetical protein